MTTEDLIAQQHALRDIKKELQKSNKRFIPFRKKLNPIMEHFVAMQIAKQEKISICISQFSKPI